jgi:hypothetical protein
LVLITRHKPQLTSELFDPTYPGAHLSLNQRHSLAPRWISPHLSLYAFPKAFLTKPDVPYAKPYEPRPYPSLARKRPEQHRSADMSMQVVAFNTRVVLHHAVRTKIKRRLKEAIRLIVTRGAAVEKSPGGPKLVFRAEDIGADKWITTGALQPTVLGQTFTDPFARRLDVYGAADHGDVPHAVCRATWPYA